MNGGVRRLDESARLRELARLREIDARIRRLEEQEKMDPRKVQGKFVDRVAMAREVAELRSIMERVRRLEDSRTGRKRKPRRQLGGNTPTGALSQLQIQRIRYYRERDLSYGEISEIMAIAKSSAHKYGRDVQSLF